MKRNITQHIEGPHFDAAVFKEAGVFIIRNAVPKDVIEDLQQEWTNFYTTLTQQQGGRTIDGGNFVNFLDQLPPKLDQFYKSESVVKIAQEVIGPNVALYHNRIVMKDKGAQHNVFLHQDFSYHLGFPYKCNLFIPLFNCGLQEGGLTYHLGSHQYGYLGDAGEINPDRFIPWQKVTPELKLGDVAVMNGLTWHESGPNNSAVDRVLFDIIVQPSFDPSGIDLIAGEWETDFWIDERKDKKFAIDSLFVNSRIGRIKSLKKLLN